jgi:hypothetical protein
VCQANAAIWSSYLLITDGKLHGMMVQGHMLTAPL